MSKGDLWLPFKQNLSYKDYFSFLVHSEDDSRSVGFSFNGTAQLGGDQNV